MTHMILALLLPIFSSCLIDRKCQMCISTISYIKILALSTYDPSSIEELNNTICDIYAPDLKAVCLGLAQNSSSSIFSCGGSDIDAMTICSERNLCSDESAVNDIASACKEFASSIWYKRNTFALRMKHMIVSVWCSLRKFILTCYSLVSSGQSFLGDAKRRLNEKMNALEVPRTH